ncbi:GGDEF domain-containing protein [Xanthobacter sediminis]
MTDLAAHLFQLQEESPVLLASFDRRDRLRYANAAYRAAYGIGGGDPLQVPLVWAEIMRRNLALNAGTVIEAGGLEKWVAWAVANRGQAPFRAVEAKLPDGRWMLMQESISASGWMFCVGCDISELRADVGAVRRDRDEALRAAHTDDLTGVANRRFVIARINEMLAQSAPAEGGCVPGALCVLDLDNFKYINDRYGHLAGDAILRDFAGCVGGHARRSDCFGRIGGEEFVLVLPDTGIEEAVRIVERMLGLVRASRPLEGMPDFSYTFSCGIAAVRPGDDFAEIYRRADKALYAAKMAGRNRVHLEEALMPPAPGDERI